MAEQITGRGARGVVAAAAPLAAALGAEAMRTGGNAYDGAVVAALAESVLLPPKCGLGGDLVALRLRAGADSPDALLAIGTAPAALGEAVARLGHLPTTGPLSVGPPGSPAGYAALAAEATRPLSELAAPAIALARDGFAWASICTVLTEESRDLLGEHQPTGTAYLPGGRPPAAGSVVRLPGLARALEAVAADGAAALEGPLGHAIVSRVRAAGGVLAPDDLASVRAEWERTDRADCAGWKIWATPAPTHGPTLLDTLVTLFATAGGRPADPVLLWQAFAGATDRRRATLGDPASSGTSMVSAAEAGGDAVVVVHSNSFPTYGSGLVVDPYDLILNNRAGRGFVAEPGHPNFPLPGRRPATTLHAWAAGAGPRPSVLGGTPGGANQVSWNAQLLAALLAGEEDLGRLVAAPRWEWLPGPDRLLVEDGFPPGTLDALAAAAPGGAEAVERWALRCAQQVLRMEVGQALVAAADPRTVGAVVAV
jgi:gamma-glutamyltranspeptidase/glutathione hydrolase